MPSEAPTLSRRARIGRPKTEDVISTSSRWTDDRRRIIQGLSDVEILIWQAQCGTLPPIRLSAERRKGLNEKRYATASQQSAHKSESIHMANEERKLEAILGCYPPQKHSSCVGGRFCSVRMQRSRLEGRAA